jgi:DNA-binding SARP family transcriptional activator
MPDPASCKRRLVRLELQATHFLLIGNEEALEALLELTHERERVLPALVPLAALPHHRPELGAAYPLGVVLRAGWPEAARLRQAEIPPLELTLLGSFSARVLGHDAELTSKHRALLTLLALGYDREHIGEALWPDTESKKVSNNLHVQLNLLRKTLEPWGFKTYLSERGLTHTRTDFWLLREALARNDAASTLALYREPFAPGTDLPLIEEVRCEVREKVVELLFSAAHRAAEPQAETYLERLLELEPLHEEALANLLERLIHSGRRREALRRYKAFVEQLREELSLEPLLRTRHIFAEGER